MQKSSLTNYLALSLLVAFINSPSMATEFAGRHVVDNMNGCTESFIVTGVHLDSNRLLCSGSFKFSLNPRVLVKGISSNNPTPDVAPFPFDGTSMHWCGPGLMVRGIHFERNEFLCQSFDAITVRQRGQLGVPFLDRGTNPTVRAGMHACPVGSVLVGAHFVSNTFLCAQLPLCADNAQCQAGKTCVRQVPSSHTGVCR